MTPADLKILTRSLIEEARKDHTKWSLQGMGMLRLHLPDNCRLHIWDSRYRVENVSMIHDHLQWGLESTVVAGSITNIRYYEITDETDPDGKDYMYTILKPGVGCFFKEEPKPIRLDLHTKVTYGPGKSYAQQPRDIHESDPLDGTVTFMRKHPTGDESARVFWPAGTEWVSAEPRPATKEQVESITEYSLRKWF